jgi:hypothetical protein
MEDVARPQRVFENSSLYSKKPYAPSQRGKEIIASKYTNLSIQSHVKLIIFF